MTGYLQRLLDTAAPAAEPPTLTPVVKSGSPIFEQNQLPGLAGLYAGEGEAEIAPRPGDVPGVPAARDPTLLPPAPAPAVPTPEITRRNPLPVPPTPAPDALVRRPVAERPPTSHHATLEATPSLPQEPSDSALEPARPDLKTIEPSPRLETALLAEPPRVTDAPTPLMPTEPVFSPAAIEQAASGATPAIERAVPLQPNETESRAGSPAGAAAKVLPIEPTSDAPLRPSVLEPRPRPDFEAADPAAAEQRSEPPPEPRITIGRVTVALVPDPAPGTAPAAPRTAAAASLIGPLGNRRARRRLFALARL
jgi:hypothetical protein